MPLPNSRRGPFLLNRGVIRVNLGAIRFPLGGRAKGKGVVLLRGTKFDLFYFPLVKRCFRLLNAASAHGVTGMGWEKEDKE